MQCLEYLEARALLSIESNSHLIDQLDLYDSVDTDLRWSDIECIPTRLVLMGGSLICGIMDGAIHAAGVALFSLPLYLGAKHLGGVEVNDIPKWVHTLVGIGFYPLLKPVLDVARSEDPIKDPLIQLISPVGSVLRLLEYSVEWMDRHPCMGNATQALMPSTIYKSWQIGADIALSTAAVHMGFAHLPEPVIES